MSNFEDFDLDLKQVSTTTNTELLSTTTILQSLATTCICHKMPLPNRQRFLCEQFQILKHITVIPGLIRCMLWRIICIFPSMPYFLTKNRIWILPCKFNNIKFCIRISSD